MSVLLQDDFTYQNRGNNAQQLFGKLSDSWSKRAQVRRCNVHDQKFFDTSKPDFIDALLPFKDLEAYQKLTQEHKGQLLTAGWLIYNSKTIDIEKEIIIPLCNRIIEGKFIGLNHAEVRRNAAEIMVDESYHILLCVTSNEITKFYRNVTINLHKANVVKKMEETVSNCKKEWQKDIVLLVTAFVSETMISDYLSLLSKNNTIQPLHKEVVYAHELDEGIHRYIFVKLLKFYLKAAPVERRRFAFQIIPDAIEWFQTPSFDAWFQLLHYLNIPNFSCSNEEIRNSILRHTEPVNGNKAMKQIPRLATKPVLEYSI